MVLRIQRIGDGLGVMLPAEVVEELNLRKGGLIEINVFNGLPEGSSSVTVEEGLEAWNRVEHLHRNTMRELAKGVDAPDDQG